MMNHKKFAKSIAAMAASMTLLVSVAAQADALKIGVMSGPTGMGMAQLMSTENAAYTYEIYSAPTNATADLASGVLDMLCLPTNTAASLSNAREDYVSVLAINCLGSLYLMTDANMQIDSIADLNGRTVYASVPSSTTGAILNCLFEKNGIDVTLEWEADHDALAAQVIAGAVSIAVLPEPKVTVAMTKAEGWKVALNLSEEWNRVCDEVLPMGCIVARNDVIRENSEAIQSFMQEYSDSIAFVGDPVNRDASAAMIAAAGVLPAEGVAKKALSNLYGSIVYMDGEKMKTALQAFYDVIGMNQPVDAFYYVQ